MVRETGTLEMKHDQCDGKQNGGLLRAIVIAKRSRIMGMLANRITRRMGLSYRSVLNGSKGARPSRRE